MSDDTLIFEMADGYLNSHRTSETWRLISILRDKLLRVTDERNTLRRENAERNDPINEDNHSPRKDGEGDLWLRVIDNEENMKEPNKWYCLYDGDPVYDHGSRSLSYIDQNFGPVTFA